MRGDELILRRATIADLDSIRACVEAAYCPYVAEIGREPEPLWADYEASVRSERVTVAVSGDELIGILVVEPTAEGLLLENVAVVPQRQGQGVGKALLLLAEAEARRHGLSTVYLYTNEKMVASLSLYQRIGYIEYVRRRECGLARVYLRKQIEAG